MSDLENFDVAMLLQEISAEEPCGTNLEYDAVFLEIEKELQGKPEVQYGEMVAEAILPNWKLVEKLALDLLSRTHDLRVVMALTRAFIHHHGFAGFALGLQLLEGLLDQRWNFVHPQLDAADDNDPMLRVNILSTLLERTTVLREVREATLVASRIHGCFCLRDIDLITGEATLAEGQEKPSQAGLDAAFAELGQEAIEALYWQLDRACNSIERIDMILTQHISAEQSIDFSSLKKLLARIRDFLQSKIIKKEVFFDKLDPDSAVNNKSEVFGMSVDQLMITSRDDLTKLLEKMCAYLADYEPSSPIPLLLRRAQRLIDKSFIEILQDIAPDSLDKVEQIAGTKQQ